jgi:predicted permease
VATRWRRFRTLFGLDPARDVEAEIAFHLEMRIQELVDLGETPARARELALRRFGDYDASRTACVAIDSRRRRRLMHIELLTDRVQDVRYALRMFRRAPAFTAIAVLTLALGIGANTAVFSIFHGLLLQRLPVPSPDRLVNLTSAGPRTGPLSCSDIDVCDAVFSYAMFRDLERTQTVFSGLAAHREFGANLGYHGETVTGGGLFVSGQYFAVLGLRPAIGRLIGPDDDRTPGASEVAVLSYDYWRNERGGRADVIGDTMFVNGIALTVVGVAPSGFAGTSRGLKPQLFVPMTMRWRLQPSPEAPPENRLAHWLYLFARLRPDVTMERAQSGIDAQFRAILTDVDAPLVTGQSAEWMARFKTRTLRLEPGARGQSRLFGDASAPLTLLLGITSLMLIVACMNVANLLLARAAARSREMGTRLSVGATRGRLVAQVLTETLVLGIGAATASLFVSRWTIGMVGSVVGNAGSSFRQFDAPGLLFTTLVALGATAIVGLIPAFHAARPQALAALKGQSAQPGGSRSAARVRTVLTATQVALSMILVVLAGLFSKSLTNLTHVDPGLAADGLVMFGISPQRNGYAAPAAAALFDRVQAEVRALPGVTGVSTSTTVLFTDDHRMTSVFVEGFSSGPDTDRTTRYDEIGEGYFRTLGTPLLAGREFTPADSAGGAPVAIVNEHFARKFGLGSNVLGKRMSARTPALDLEIVGLVKNARYSSFRDAAAPMYFVPHRQTTRRPGQMTFYVRTPLRMDELVPGIRGVVRRLDPNLPIGRLGTLRAAMRATTERDRLLGLMAGAFAGLALLIAAVGLYGVLAYAVNQRTPEIGLRMALGATRGAVRRMMMRHMASITIAGGAVGLLLALLIARAAEALLFGLRFYDVPVLAAAIVLLAAVVSAAGFLPAARAARIDPMRALKCE